MADHLGVVEKGRAALLAGELSTECPPVEGQIRWGLAMLFRPDSKMLARLAEFGSRISAAAGGNHWAHGVDGLHVSLRPLERFHEQVGDISGYVAALQAAVAGRRATRVGIRTVSPHPGGVAVHVHPHDNTLDQISSRLGPIGKWGDWTRDIWYSNLVHFAGPVDVDDLIDWTDEHRDTDFGTTSITAAELVRYRFAGTGMRAETLHRVPLG